MKSKLPLLYIAVTALFLMVFAVSSCNRSGTDNPSAKGSELRGKISISGAFALYPMTVRWSEEFRKLHPGVTINISAGGAGKGMADALSGMVDLGMYSKEVSPEEKAKGAWYIGVAKDAVLLTVNSANPVLSDLKRKGLSRQKLYEIFILAKVKTWGVAVENTNPAELHVFTRSDACGAADMWARYLNKKTQEDLQGYGVNGDPGVADAVRRNIGGIGYNNLNFVFDMQTRKIYQGMEVIPLDQNNNGIIDPEEDFYGTLDDVMKAIADGRYPSPPARDLYLVSGGKPKNPLVTAFLEWILTDGQRFVPEAGYVTLSPEKINESLTKLR